jgi:hypothetical protein
MPLFLSITLIVIAGLLTKQYSGWGREWINDSAGDILYEIFWCLTLFALFPYKNRIVPICLGVFIFTCGLEFLQLYNPPFLEAWRSHFLGKLILGTTFSWWDFPHYLLGCILGWWWLQKLSRGT